MIVDENLLLDSNCSDSNNEIHINWTVSVCVQSVCVRAFI